MSRSYKKPIIQLTHSIDKAIAHKQLRRKIKAELDKAEPDECIIDLDTRGAGLEEWGTKFDMRFDGGVEWGDWYDEEKEKSKRK